MRVFQDGQKWFAWRRTVTGWVFAIGAGWIAAGSVEVRRARAALGPKAVQLGETSRLRWTQMSTGERQVLSTTDGERPLAGTAGSVTAAPRPEEQEVQRACSGA